MTTPGPLSGQTLGSKYRLGPLLGSGGFGAVYQAENLLLHRPQAVKVLLDAHASDDKFRERLLREARLLSALDHPHIVHVDDLGMEGALVYLVLPFLSGGTLQDRLHAQTGPLPLSEVQRALEQICAALEYAHRRNVVHLDLKPANVLVHEDGRLLLSDFGLAHLLAQGAVAGGTSLHFGSPLYMAPEQFEGKPTPQSDLYALGVILYQLLTDKPPFEASTPAALMRQHLLEPPPPLRVARPDLPAGIEAVLVRLLAKQPEQRYARAEDVLHDVQAALSGQAVPLLGAVPGPADAPGQPSSPPLTPPVGASQFTGTPAALPAQARAAMPAPLPVPQTRRCVSCGAQTPLPMRFCGVCGRPLDVQPQGAPGFPAPGVALPLGFSPPGPLPVAKPRGSGLLLPVVLLAALLLVLVVAGTTVLVALKSFSHAAPLVPPGTITEFPIPTPGSQPSSLTIGPDKNLWFIESQTNKIGRITPGGKITEFAMPSDLQVSIVGNSTITIGPDGNLWIVPEGLGLLRMTPGGAVTAVPFQGDPHADFCYAITTGPDGNLWCAGVNNILRITLGGAVTAFPVPKSATPTYSITAGPDGNLWFIGGTHPLAEIGRMTLSGAVTLFALPQPREPTEIILTPGPDGNLWFAEGGSEQIGRITPSGTITEFSLPPGSGAVGIAAGPNGNLWFTDDGNNQIGRMTTSGAVKEFPIPTSVSEPTAIIAGPDGNLWFTENQGNQIGRITP